MRSHYEYKLVGFNIYCTVAKYNTKTINQWEWSWPFWSGFIFGGKHYTTDEVHIYILYAMPYVYVIICIIDSTVYNKDFNI